MARSVVNMHEQWNTRDHGLTTISGSYHTTHTITDKTFTASPEAIQVKMEPTPDSLMRVGSNSLSPSASQVGVHAYAEANANTSASANGRGHVHAQGPSQGHSTTQMVGDWSWNGQAAAPDGGSNLSESKLPAWERQPAELHVTVCGC